MSDNPNNQSSLNVVLRAHQQDFVNEVINSEVLARFLLSSPPGAGKAAAMAAAAGALKAKRGKLRCLAIVPSSLAPMWQDQLIKFGGLEVVVMTPQTYRRLQAETGGNVNVWSTMSCVIVSIDFLKSNGRMDEVLASGWDLVLLDEVHRATTSTQRGEVTKQIWAAPGVAIAVATTGLPNYPTWLAEDTRTKNVHWKLANLIRQGMVPQRRIHTISYTPSLSERHILGRIQDLLGQAQKDQQAPLIVSVLSRRLSSSTYAFEQTLRRLLTVETFGDTELNDWSSDDLAEGAEKTELANSVRIVHQAGEEILTLIESEPRDSKWECCFQLLSSHGIGKTCSGILFTDYAETAEYLEYLARSCGLKVCLITGAVTPEARADALHEDRSNPALLIVTGATEGVDLPVANQVIHYDLPWNPRSLLHRIARVERVASDFKAFDHYFILRQDSVSHVLARLLEKVHAIEQE